MDEQELLRLFVERRSIRKYHNLPVEWEKLGMVLEAARNAPSSGNLQNWKFVIVRDKEKREKIAEACLKQYWMLTAPVHIVVYALPELCGRFYGSRGKNLYSIQNCAAAIENMLIMAHALGLGTCWVGAFDENMLIDTVGSKAGAVPQAVITIGYADERPPNPGREDFYSMVFLEEYGQRVSDKDIVNKNYGKKLQKSVKELATKLTDVSEKELNKTKPLLNKLKEKLRKLP